MPSNKNAQAIMDAIATDKTKVLGVVIGDKKIDPPGLYIPRAEARPLPQLSFAVPDQTKRYIVVSLDFDAPYPSAPFLGPVLHWIQPNLVPSPSSGPDATTDADGGGGGGAAGAVVKLESKDAQEGKGFVANYLSPNPPPGSAPHRYGFYLYEQPGGFDAARWAPAAGAKLGHVARVRYSLDDWEREAGLGRVLAANYFTSN